jgi:iron complex transport system ATP-binding protein
VELGDVRDAIDLTLHSTSCILLELVKNWVRQENRSVISVVHDLSLVKAFGTDVLLLSGGKTVAFGKADEVLRDENLDKAYGMPVRDWMRSLLSQWE